jgi:ABC-type glycerol-3-phosphate transport system substrate-binding protein
MKLELKKSPKLRILLVPLAILVAIAAIGWIILPCLYIDLFPDRVFKDTYKNRIRVIYWEKWTGIEAEAMQFLVDKFNGSQERIWVEMQVTSSIDQRFLLSVAGKNPPDVAGLALYMIPSFAEKGALMPLDDLVGKYGIKKEDYIAAFWNMGYYKDSLFALPTTPVTLALHYNKRLFREAGLDPDSPPRTIKELDDFAEKLTKYDKFGNIDVIGFTPSYPGWWHWAWGFWFGGELWDGKKITITDPKNINAFVWIQSYARKYGVSKLQDFQSGFGNFRSSQNPFISEKIAMEVQGVWMYNFIDKYNPDMEWGVAPFPSVDGSGTNCSIADCDNLVIPTDARHPVEAFEFIAFVQKQKNMEILCMRQKKFSPLINVSKEFWDEHPHPYIRTFYDLARSPQVKTQPQIPVFQQMRDELKSACSEVLLLEKTPEQALIMVQKRIGKEWKSEKRKIDKRDSLEIFSGEAIQDTPKIP